MKHYGAEPPWPGYSEHYGSWRRGPELWDGSTEWTWQPPGRHGGATISILSNLLRDLYLPVIQETLSQPIPWDSPELHTAVHQHALTSFPDPEDDDEWDDWDDPEWEDD